MTVKFGLMTINEGIMCVKRLDWRKVGPCRENGGQKWLFLRWGIFLKFPLFE